MKKILIGSSIILGLLIGLSLIVSVWFFFKNQAELKKMTPLPTRKNIEGIITINNDFVNFYLIPTKQGLIAVDAGGNLNKTVQELKQLSIDPRDVIAVFLTHSDYDHIAAVKLFKQAEIYLPKDEEQMINGKTHRQLIFNNSLPVHYHLFSDRNQIWIGNDSIEGFATPGHTPGSMAYLVDKKYLFTGDTLSLKNGHAKLFNSFFNMDSKTEKKSIQKLSTIPGIQYIFTAHYGYSNKVSRVFEKRAM
jgi:glyoxylase-like metal-dependent hydrolase (beta-lactamase superfamily II)